MKSTVKIAYLAVIFLLISSLYVNASPSENEIDTSVEKAVSEEATPISEELGSADLTDKLLSVARELIGIPYRFGGNTLKGIDCSAYVKKVFAMLNIDLPRSAREQFRLGRDVPKEKLAPGDMVFFRTYAKYPSHVGIFIGEDKFIHAPSKGKKVSISSLNEPYYSKRFIGAKRLDL